MFVKTFCRETFRDVRELKSDPDPALMLEFFHGGLVKTENLSSWPQFWMGKCRWKSYDLTSTGSTVYYILQLQSVSSDVE